MRRSAAIAICLGLWLASPSWAQLDGLVSGIRSVKDEAHKRIMENQLIQLVIEAKRNYDASMKIYKQVKQLNEGRGLVRNVASDLEQRARAMAKEERDAFLSDFAYRNDSGLDRYLQSLDAKVQRGVTRGGFQLLDRYGSGIDQKSAAYAKSLKDKGEQMLQRKKRGEASRREGVKIASIAPDLASKAAGLELQTFSDSVDALNELVALQLGREAKERGKELLVDKEIADALRFLYDRQGAAKALQESFYLVRLSRAPGLLYMTRKTVSRLAAMLLGLFLAAGLLYEFSQTRGIVPEVMGLPLALVVFGLVFYDKAFASFAVILDTVEQTLGSGEKIAQTALSLSSGAGISGYALLASTQALRWLATGLGYLMWAVVIVFLWVRFAFFCLLYAVGPLLIVCALFAPMREMALGWLKAVVQVGLWGVLMRILVVVVANSGIAGMSDPSGGALKPLFANLVMDLVFLVFALICPYFTHHLLSGHIGERALGTLSAGRAGFANAQRAIARAQEFYRSRKETPQEKPA